MSDYDPYKIDRAIWSSPELKERAREWLLSHKDIPEYEWLARSWKMMHGEGLEDE